MEDCTHVKQVKLAADRSFLNPRNWSCSECGTTESVWVNISVQYDAESSSLLTVSAGMSAV